MSTSGGGDGLLPHALTGGRLSGDQARAIIHGVPRRCAIAFGARGSTPLHIASAKDAGEIQIWTFTIVNDGEGARIREREGERGCSQANYPFPPFISTTLDIERRPMP